MSGVWWLQRILKDDWGKSSPMKGKDIRVFNTGEVGDSSYRNQHCFCWRGSREEEATANLSMVLEYSVQVGSEKVKETKKWDGESCGS